MREGWETTTLGNVCEFENGDRGKNYPGRKAFVPTGVPFINAGHLDDGNICWQSMDFIPRERFDLLGNGKIQKGDLLFCLRGSLGKFGLVDRHTEGAIASSLVIVRPNEKLDNGFLAAYFRSKLCTEMIYRFANGAAQPNLSAKSLKRFEIPLPPLTEQQRIVAILDEAFKGIDQAVANAEKNLANAREVFENYLNAVFINKGEGWVSTTLGELCTKVEYGSSSKSKSEGKVPVLRMGNIQDGMIIWDDIVFTDNAEEIEKYRLKKHDVLFNRTNSAELVGKTAIYKGERPAIFAGYLIRIHRKEDLLDAGFLNYYLNSSLAKEYGNIVMSRSINQANINGTKLKQYPISVPDIKKQQEIVVKLRNLEIETQRLEAIYQQKLDGLAELKQSLLQKAFAGELTSNNTASVSGMKEELATVSPEFSANVLAFAYYRHAYQHREKTFGRVKAQKTLHLVESVGSIDLGRRPIKDAAGPNDFRHMLDAEDWAKENAFFEFVSRGNGYVFKKLARYDELVIKALEAIKPFSREIENIVDLVIPLNSQQAEVLATVHAAWNNLILDNAEVTDDVIIREARENWHPDKVKIPESEFRKAIDKIRANDLVPEGKSKRVGGQERLF